MALVLYTLTDPGDADWVDASIIGGPQSLAQTLVIGNYTGGTNIEMTSGDMIVGQSSVVGDANGFPVVLHGGEGSGTGGLGAIQARLDGNARGLAAIDLQQIGAAADVAAAPYSAILGGSYNTIDEDADRSVVIGGYDNSIAGLAMDSYGSMAILGGYRNSINSAGGVVLGVGSYTAAIVGGRDNSITGDAYGSVILGGYENLIDGTSYSQRGSVAFGTNNTVEGSGASGSYSAFAGGTGNTITGAPYGVALGRNNTVNEILGMAFGQNNQVDAGFATVIGDGNVVGVYAQAAFGAGRSLSLEVDSQWAGGGNTAGVAQFSQYYLSRVTTNATPAELSVNGIPVVDAGDRITVRLGTSCAFRILVSARQTAGAAGTIGDSAGWVIQGMIKRSTASTTVLVGAVAGAGTPSLVNDAGAAAWSIAVTADDPNDALVLTVTGEANKTITWSAIVYASEAS